MKSLLKNVAFGVLVAASLTACHTESDNTVVVPDVVRTSAKMLVLHANTSATFTYGGQTKTGTDVTFNPTANAGTVNITATGKNALALDFDFNGGEYLEYDVVLVTPAPAVAANVAEATGANPVKNGDINAQENGGVTAEFSVAGNTNNGTTGPYSITVFTPASTQTDVEDIEKSDVVEEPVLSLDCRPDGAVFENPINVTMNVPGSAGYNVGCYDENGDEIPSSHVGDQVQFELSHFSFYDLILKATAANIKENVQEYVYTGDAAKGSIDYTLKYGFENNDNSSLIKKFLNKLYGTAVKDNSKSVTFKKVDGTAKLIVSQEVKDYEYTSGDKTFTVRVYGKINEKLEIEAATEVAPTIPTHNGGSND